MPNNPDAPKAITSLFQSGHRWRGADDPLLWMRNALILLGLVALLPANGSGMTWDEPWMDLVISNAESFVRVKVLESHPEEFRAKVTKRLSGTNTPSEIRIVGCSLVHPGSYSSHEADLKFGSDSDYYLFLRKANTGAGYLIETPTTGWAKVNDKGVNATYRHSYHQALVPEEVYETTMVAIFNKIHGIKGDETQAQRFVSAELSQPPAIMKDATDETRAKFFLQHAALETFRYIGSEKDLTLIDPFLQADDFHVQISAVRSIDGMRSETVSRKLMDFIEAERYGFAKVMAVWGLRDQKARGMLPRLRKFLANGKDEETGFGGNLMDPRIGTEFPSSIKAAIKELMETWDKESAKTAQPTGARRSAQGTNRMSSATDSRRSPH